MHSPLVLLTFSCFFFFFAEAIPHLGEPTPLVDSVKPLIIGLIYLLLILVVFFWVFRKLDGLGKNQQSADDSIPLVEINV